jgi:hypothetical protein
LVDPLPVVKLQVFILQLGLSLVGTLTLPITPCPRHDIEFETYRLYIMRPGRREGYLSTTEPSRAIFSCMAEQVIDLESYVDMAIAFVENIPIVAKTMIFFIGFPFVGCEPLPVEIP